MKNYSSKEIIKGIARQKDSIFRHVYKSCYPAIRKLTLANGGNEHDAQDLFQEGMIKVYQKISEGGLELQCKFGTYLYSVCRFLWLNELEKRKVSARESLDDNNIIDDRAANNIIRENAELNLYRKHFSELGKECQTVLNMYFQKKSMEEICVVMGYKNVQIAKNKKHLCKKALMNKIQSNPEFKKLQDEIFLAG